MNSIRSTQALNKRELENAVPPSASWHADYRDTAWIYIGGLPFDLSEGDLVTIFSQYGEPTHVNLIRDRDTGKSKGFGFLKYEDQRSTDLAVDNLGGATVLGRMLRVDHTRYKKKEKREGEESEEEDNVKVGKKPRIDINDGRGREGSASEEEEKPRRPLLKEERELAQLLREHDDEDPMKDYLIKEKKEEVEQALARLSVDKDKSRRHKHRHHRDREHDGDEDRRRERDRHREKRSRRRSVDGDRNEEDYSREKRHVKRRSPSVDDHEGKSYRRDLRCSRSRDRADYRRDDRRSGRDGGREHSRDRHRDRADERDRRRRRLDHDINE